MDYTKISCGVIGQENIPADKIEPLKQKIGEETESVFKAGYRLFVIGLTGEPALLFTEAALNLRQNCPDVRVELFIPYDEWIDEQSESARYSSVMAQADGANFSCDEPFEDSVDILNNQLLDVGNYLVIIHDGTDEEINNVIDSAHDMEKTVREFWA